MTHFKRGNTATIREPRVQASPSGLCNPGFAFFHSERPLEHPDFVG
jgi:hypothetical protein